MWIVLKFKLGECEILKNSISKVLGCMPEFYNPKIKLQKHVNNKLKIYKKYVLNNYLICKHEKFKNRSLVNSLKNIRGLNYFLEGFEHNQKELENFVKYCKSNEDIDGFLKQSFFNISHKIQCKFVSGPFTEMIFNVIENKGKKLKILIKNLNITVSKNSKNLLYSNI